jgi:hypothetical protein
VEGPGTSLSRYVLREGKGESRIEETVGWRGGVSQKKRSESRYIAGKGESRRKKKEREGRRAKKKDMFYLILSLP